jgi:hypothetical protein
MAGSPTIRMQRHMHPQATVGRVNLAADNLIMKWKVIISQRNNSNSRRATRITHGKSQRRLPSNYSTIISSLRRRRHSVWTASVAKTSTNRGTKISMELTTSSSRIASSRAVTRTGSRDRRRAQEPSRPSSTREIHPEENHPLLSDTPT